MSALVTSAIIGAAGALGSAGLSSGAAGKLNRVNRDWQERMTVENFQRQKDYADYLSGVESKQNADYWRKYNSPAAQKAASLAAGVNPFAAGSNIQPFSADPGSYSGSSPDTPTPSTPFDNAAFGNIAPAFSQGVQQILQARQAEANIQLTNASALKTQAETIKTQQENSLFAFTKAAAESDALSKQFKARISEVEAQFAEAQAVTDLSERNARIESIWAQAKNSLSQAAKTDADRMYLDFMKDANRAQVQSQTTLNQAQAGAATSSAALSDSQRQTEDELRRLRKALTQSQIGEITQKVRESRVLTAQGIEKLNAWLRGDREASSLFGLIDKYVTGSGKDLLSLQYNNDLRNYLYSLMNGE